MSKPDRAGLAVSVCAHVHCAALAVLCAVQSVGADVQRPRLLFGTEDVPALRERAGREPHAAFYRNHRRIFEEKARLPDAELDSLLMDSQIGALLYLIDGEREQARRAKRAFLYRLASWAKDIPAYDYEKRKHRISLFVSRQLQNMCLDFDLLASSGAFTEGEKQRARSILAMVVARLMERGTTFNPYDYYLERFRVDNWNTDRITAVGMFALAFPDHPESDALRKHAIDELTWQLEHALLPDGAWPEGTRYHGAILRSMVPFVYALRRNGGPDFFEHPRFRALFESLIHLQTPRVRGLDDAALLPGISNANWESIWEAVLGWAAAGFARHDPGFAGRLIWAWQRAGSPFVVEFSPGNPIVGFLLIDPELRSHPQPDLQSERLPGGYAVLRHDFDTEREGYFLFNVAAPRGAWQHQHRDRGSFSLFAWNTPLAVDPGVRDYGPSLGRWFSRSRAHNQVVFEDADARDGGRIVDHLFTENLDYACADLTKSFGAEHIRHVFLVKPDYYLIWDQIDSPSPAEYHLHVLARENAEPERITGSSARMEIVRIPCMSDIQLEIGVVSPLESMEQKRLKIDRDPYPVTFHVERGSLPTTPLERTPQWVRIRQEMPGQDFVTILYPRRAESEDLKLVRFENRAHPASAPESMLVELQRGSARSLFLLGPQDKEGFSLDGKAAVRLRDQQSPHEHLLLVGARELRLPGSKPVALEDRETTLVSTPRKVRTPARLVKPIDWSRFRKVSEKSAHYEQCARILSTSLRCNLSWMDATFRKSDSGEKYVLPRMDEHGIRPACSVVYALATGLKTAGIDAGIDMPTREAVHSAIMLLRGVVTTHKVNNDSDKAWGDAWQSALWAALAGMGGWMLWDDLDPRTRDELASMVIYEADRFNHALIPYWNGKGGDTKAEENAWNAMILSLAASMMPAHSHADPWKRKCSELMVSAYATEADWRKNETVLDGRSVRQWLKGYNALDGGVVLNHGFVHPDYMAAQTMNLWAYLTRSLAGLTVPQTAQHNGKLIYHTFVSRRWPAPPHVDPGGTIYHPDRPEVYYPKGTDWSTYDVAAYYLMDVWAHVLGWDGDLPVKASRWMNLRANRMLKMQARHKDGRMFAKGEYDTYPGAEQWIAWCVTDARLALWLDATNTLGAPTNWLESAASLPSR